MNSLSDSTIQKGYQPYGQVKKTTADEMPAYNFRYGSTTIGSQQPGYPTPYVTTSAIQYKWI